MSYLRWWIAGLFVMTGVGWLLIQSAPPDMPKQDAATVEELSSGIVAKMDSSLFKYSPQWQIDAIGADPSEPADPLQMPSGVITFTYRGGELAILLATGDYWGYLYVTVDGQPANLLPRIAGNTDSEGMPAAYKPLYEPAQEGTQNADAHWLRIHRASQPNEAHQVRLEVWRSWGQTPIRAVAVDALPAAPRSQWPAVVMILLALTILGIPSNVVAKGREKNITVSNTENGSWQTRFLGARFRLTDWRLASLLVWGVSLVMIAVGVTLGYWWLCLSGLAILGLLGLLQPALWLAAFLFALPFYFSFPLPILPNRSVGIIDIGILGGIAVFFANFLLSHFSFSKFHISSLKSWRLCFEGGQVSRSLAIWLITGWALVATLAAEHFGVALREWRTVFLAAAIFSLLLKYGRAADRGQHAIKTHYQTIIGAWILGSVAIAVIGLWAYATHYAPYLVGAEGVTRLRSVYGSPNNLAAYLERTLAVCLALALFSSHVRTKRLAALAALPQIAALLLTFSKGGIFLGLPVMMAVLAIGGGILLRRQGRSIHLLGWLAGLLIVAGLALIPAIGSERLRGLFDPSSATSLMRVNLWRSSWQMALDHPWLGVGPDNFLYIYRSGYLLPEAWKEPNLNHPHNFVLDWWTRLGVPGLLFGLAWWGGMIKGLWRSIVRPIANSAEMIPDNALQLGLLAAVLASLAHGLIDISYALPDLMIVWVLMAELEGAGMGLGFSDSVFRVRSVRV